MQDKAFGYAHEHAHHQKLAAVAAVSSFNSGAAIDRSTLKLELPRDRSRSTTVASGSMGSGPEYLMQIIVDAESVTDLRHLLICICGRALEYVRVQAIPNRGNMRVFLCQNQSDFSRVMDAIMGTLPHAEFGRVASA
jgi:hypothetical protein